MTRLVIVESPTKARTIERYLPPGHAVYASMGHVRDLPASAAEIPKALREQPWSRLGIDVEHGFLPLYVITPRRRETIKKLQAALKTADELVIATDEDREGESIGWHLVEVLAPAVPVRRMVFHEITRPAIEAALTHTRSIDMELVRAQETRRLLDRLVGYSLSPLLWRKIGPKLSAGRVQSVAVRLLVERERQRRAFVSGGYWDLEAKVAKRQQGAIPFAATLVAIGGKPVATGKDFDEHTGRVGASADVVLLDQGAAEALAERLRSAAWQVTAVDEKDAVRRPYPPFTTSTLQQEAGRKLGLSARETMRVAQELYEKGHITYHRTDSVSMAEEAVKGARRRIGALYGDAYLSPAPRRYRTRTRGAQEAHEAIRPAGGAMSPVADLSLSGRNAQLYDLIWKRTMATQMADARLSLTTVQIAAADTGFRASGRRVQFAGFFRVYVEGTDDPDAVLEDRDAPLPQLAVGEELDLRELAASGHETKPPPRHTEATLVKLLEADGIGRPSTYATIIGTIQDRGYVIKQRQALVPTFTAFAVTGLLESEFRSLVDEGFTATMESDLDHIEEGTVDPGSYLARFYLGENGLAAQVASASERVDPRRASTVDLGDLVVRIGRYGPYVEASDDGRRVTAALPDDIPPADLTPEMVAQVLAQGGSEPRLLGADPETGMNVYLKEGPYGPYVQRGEDGTANAVGEGTAEVARRGKPTRADGADRADEGTRRQTTRRREKPARSSLPKTLSRADVDLPTALALLALPREVGAHPETGKVIKAGIGRFGPYVVHDGTFASLGKNDDVLTVDLERAVAVLAAKQARAARRSTGAGRRSAGRPTRRRAASGGRKAAAGKAKASAAGS